MTEKVFRYKLDFYYKSLIIYFIFLVVYALIRGNFSEERISIVFKDPIIYLTMIFIVLNLVALTINALKSKRIIFMEDRIMLRNRFGARQIMFNEIISLRFSKERGKQVDGNKKIRLVKLKLINRKRILRLRISEYYDERKLIQEFKSIKPYNK